MTHLEVTSLLLLMKTFYTASQGRCGHLTTKTPEKKSLAWQDSWLNSDFDIKWKDLAIINDFCCCFKNKAVRQTSKKKKNQDCITSKEFNAKKD